MRPHDRTHLLDAYGDKSDFAEVGRIHDEDAARLQHLEIRHAELVITVPTLRFIPYNDASSGMDALDGFAFQDRSIARRMETMVVKDVEDDMRRHAALETSSIRAIAQEIEPVGDRRRLDRGKSDFAIARTYKVES